MMFVSPRHPVLRVLRALVFATVCVVISAGGHAFAGGGSVPPGILGAGALVAMVLAYALSGREPRIEPSWGTPHHSVRSGRRSAPDARGYTDYPALTRG